MNKFKGISAFLLATVASAVFAQTPDASAARVGLGQDTATTPAMIRNLHLNDPLVQQKYLNEPDILRFLRGTYSEACARGLVNQATRQIKYDLQGKYTADQRGAAMQLLDSQRIWKMTSFEMESLFGSGYLNAANYCDCVMKEVSDVDLVNPKKGMEMVEKLPKSTQQSCERIGKEQTERQLAQRKPTPKN